MPASNSTVRPASGVASSARVASGIRLSSSGGIHFAHIARGALPNIEPPSRRWLLPSIDQSFMPSLQVAHVGLADRVARIGAGLEAVFHPVPGHRLPVAPGVAGAAALGGLVLGAHH